MKKEVLTTFEAAHLCHVSYNTIKNWVKRGLLDAYRTAGGHMRIKAVDLEAFCREHGMVMEEMTDPYRRKVLIVDDEEGIRMALKETLEQYPGGLDVFVASDGFEAGSMLETTKPDLVVLDLIMPGMDGFKVCERIRKSDDLKNTKIIILSGFSTEDNFGRAREAGADVCLAKPLDRNLLFDSVQKILEPRRGVRGRRRRLKTA